jgi:putative redox protein
MKAVSTWTEKLQIVTTLEDHSTLMDAPAPLGNGAAPTPKELLLAALTGCTAMDVVSLLKKNRQHVERFTVGAEARVSATHPKVFTEISLAYRITGAVSRDLAVEAVRLSESRYCAVGAMLSRVVPIRYSVELNGLAVASGQASFEVHIGEPSEEIA